MRDLELNRIYKHFKGDLYLVTDIAIDSETNKKVVIYRALYGENTLYVRDYDILGSTERLALSRFSSGRQGEKS